MLKKGICVILSLLVLVGVVPVAQVASADASLNLYDITSTNYGVIDKDVIATRFAEGDGYDCYRFRHECLRFHPGIGGGWHSRCHRPQRPEYYRC